MLCRLFMIVDLLLRSDCFSLDAGVYPVTEAAIFQAPWPWALSSHLPRISCSKHKFLNLVHISPPTCNQSNELSVFYIPFFHCLRVVEKPLFCSGISFKTTFYSWSCMFLLSNYFVTWLSSFWKRTTPIISCMAQISSVSSAQPNFAWPYHLCSAGRHWSIDVRSNFDPPLKQFLQAHQSFPLVHFLIGRVGPPPH